MENLNLVEFIEVESELQVLKLRVATLEEKSKSLKKEIIPLLQKEGKITVGSFLLKIGRKGFVRENFSYKEAFSLSLTKVNATIRKILEDALESTKTRVNIDPTVEILKNS